jgi:uncharacterized protein YcbX
VTTRHIGRVSHIAIYPVKGCRRVDLQSTMVNDQGLVGDREYMIVRDETEAENVHPFVTQRDKRTRTETKPQSLAILARIQPELNDKELKLSWEGLDAISLPRDQRGVEMKVRIHHDIVSSEDQGDDVARWLSDILAIKARLVRTGMSFRRLAAQKYMQNTNSIRFQDAYPVHWVMQESVDELSVVARQQIPWTRFRPNFVAEGGTPQSEHGMYEGTIGKIRFVQPKPCTRCPVTTVDQEAGEKRDNEPLTSLSSYQRWERTKETVFGENILPLENGLVKVGDPIVQTSARNPRLAYLL